VIIIFNIFLKNIKNLRKIKKYNLIFIKKNNMFRNFKIIYKIIYYNF